MLIALDDVQNRVRATPGSRALCPECNELVVPKCGTINIWHWAHKTNSDCTYGEGVGEWHLRLQNYALDNGGDVEVPFKNRFGKIIRRADIVIGKRVIELQHSNINSIELQDRCNFYLMRGFLVDWLVDYRKNNFIHIGKNLIIADGRHKKHFDVLFKLRAGRVIFDIDYGVKYIVTDLRTELELQNESSFGSRYKKLFRYSGYCVDNFIDVFAPEI